MTSGITESLFIFGGGPKGGGQTFIWGAKRTASRFIVHNQKSMGGGGQWGDPWCEWGGGACPPSPPIVMPLSMTFLK